MGIKDAGWAEGWRGGFGETGFWRIGGKGPVDKILAAILRRKEDDTIIISPLVGWSRATHGSGRLEATAPPHHPHHTHLAQRKMMAATLAGAEHRN